MKNSVFNTHNVLVCRSSNVRDLQLCFTDEGQDKLSADFQEYLEEHFEPEERESSNNSVIFKQFMEETFYPDEIPSEYSMKVYLDVENGFNPQENKNTVEWNIVINEL